MGAVDLLPEIFRWKSNLLTAALTEFFVVCQLGKLTAGLQDFQGRLSQSLIPAGAECPAYWACIEEIGDLQQNLQLPAGASIWRGCLTIWKNILKIPETTRVWTASPSSGATFVLRVKYPDMRGDESHFHSVIGRLPCGVRDACVAGLSEQLGAATARGRGPSDSGPALPSMPRRGHIAERRNAAGV